MNKYYVYLHLDVNGSVFYVGRGSGKRAWSKFYRNSGWEEIASNGFTVEIVKENLHVDEANTLEKELIEKFKTSIVNRTKSFSIIPIIYDDISKYFKYDESSPSCLTRILQKETPKGKLIGELGYTGHILKAANPLKSYWKVKHNGKSLSVHRVIWVLINKTNLTNEMVIDHIDGDGLNNNALNLRICTQQENTKNRQFHKGSSNNPSGFYGVHWEKPSYDCKLGRWIVTYSLDGKQKSKSFNPVTLFKNLPFEEAKQKSFELAVEFRKEIENTIYKIK